MGPEVSLAPWIFILFNGCFFPQLLLLLLQVPDKISAVLNSLLCEFIESHWQNKELTNTPYTDKETTLKELFRFF